MDPIHHRFIRGAQSVRPMGMTIRQKAHAELDSYQMCVTTVDTFTALCNNSLDWDTKDGFRHSQLDVDWVAVPVTQSMIGQEYMVPYIASFLSSDLWSGTVTQHTLVSRPAEDTTLTFSEATMPCINNIDVPGCRQVMLVLMDETSQFNSRVVSLKCGTAVINLTIWTGRNEMDTRSFGTLWRRFWCTENIEKIGMQGCAAYDEIVSRLSVGQANHLALSLVSELCMARGTREWRLSRPRVG